MELKPGFKQTEIGVIPEDWCITRLGTVAHFRTGPFGSALHKSDYVFGGVPVINPMQIIDGKIVSTPRMAICEAAAQNLSEFRLLEGDIVIGRRGEMGRCAVVQPDQSGWLCGTGSMIVRPKASLEARFAQRLLSSSPVIAVIEATSVGTTMINLNQSTLSNLKVPIPPAYIEQQAIAEVLNDVDVLIESLEKLLTKKRLINQGSMQELLTGERRLPGFSGEWEATRLFEVAEMGSGGTPLSSVAAYYDGDIPWVSISDMTKGGKLIRSTERNLSALGLAHSAARMFPAGTVLYAMYASLGECSVAGVSVCTSQAILGIRVKADKLDSEFLYHYLVSLKAVVKELGQQGTQSNLNKGMVQNFILKLPSLVEQKAIVSILSEMDDELNVINAKLQKSRNLKQGLMQELLTGRIRLV